MKNQFVTFEIAKRLKELGFNQPCISFYFPNGKFDNAYCIGWATYPNTTQIAAPLWQQALDWLRTEHNKLINVYSNASGYCFEWHDNIGGTHRFDSIDTGPNDSACWDSYEDAREAAIIKALSLIK